MNKKTLKKYSLEIILFVSSIITIVSFMLMSSQTVVQENQQFIQYVEEYSKLDMYLIKVLNSFEYGDVIYTSSVVRFYNRVTEKKLVSSFDKVVFSNNVVLIKGKSHVIDFRIENPKVYIDPDFVHTGSAYGVIKCNIVYNLRSVGKGNAVGVFVVQISYNNGQLNISYEYGKLYIPAYRVNLYLIYLDDKGVFKGYDDPRKLPQLFNAKGELIDPVDGSVINVSGGVV